MTPLHHFPLKAHSHEGRAEDGAGALNVLESEPPPEALQQEVDPPPPQAAQQAAEATLGVEIPPEQGERGRPLPHWKRLERMTLFSAPRSFGVGQ